MFDVLFHYSTKEREPHWLCACFTLKGNHIDEHVLLHLGKGTMLTANLRMSAFSWPGNLKSVHGRDFDFPHFPETGGDPGHGLGHQLVQVTEGRTADLESFLADVVQCLVIC